MTNISNEDTPTTFIDTVANEVKQSLEDGSDAAQNVIEDCSDVSTRAFDSYVDHAKEFGEDVLSDDAADLANEGLELFRDSVKGAGTATNEVLAQGVETLEAAGKKDVDEKATTAKEVVELPKTIESITHPENMEVGSRYSIGGGLSQDLYRGIGGGVEGGAEIAVTRLAEDEFEIEMSAEGSGQIGLGVGRGKKKVSIEAEKGAGTGITLRGDLNAMKALRNGEINSREEFHEHFDVDGIVKTTEGLSMKAVDLLNASREKTTEVTLHAENGQFAGVTVGKERKLAVSGGLDVTVDGFDQKPLTFDIHKTEGAEVSVSRDLDVTGKIKGSVGGELFGDEASLNGSVSISKDGLEPDGYAETRVRDEYVELEAGGVKLHAGEEKITRYPGRF